MAFPAPSTAGPPAVTAVVAKLGVDKVKNGFCLANEPNLNPKPSALEPAIGADKPPLTEKISFVLPKTPSLPG